MGFSRARFPSMPFARGGHPLERKKTGPHASIALLEFEPGFADPNWCRRAHVIYVAHGTLSLETESGWEQVAAGECCVLDGGTPHRAANAGDVAVLAFVVSDARLPGSEGDA